MDSFFIPIVFTSLVIFLILFFIIFYFMTIRTRKVPKVQILENQTKQTDTEQIYGYRKHVSILTKRELPFYKSLKQIAENEGMELFAKVRMADVIRPRAEQDNPEYMKAFNRIKSKHVDFLLCNNVTLQPILAIELDDMTHEKVIRLKRDIFVDEAFKSAGIKILHTYNDISLEEKINKAIESNYY